MNEANVEHRVFILTIIGKAVLGVAQIATAIAVHLGAVQMLPKWMEWVFQRELAEDPKDFLATQLLSIVNQIPNTDVAFYTIYFAAHGVVHVGIVIALLSGIRWANTAAVATLGIFVIYQLFEWLSVGGPTLLILTAIDIIVIVLTIRDHKHRTSHAH